MARQPGGSASGLEPRVGESPTDFRSRANATMAAAPAAPAHNTPSRWTPRDPYANMTRDQILATPHGRAIRDTLNAGGEIRLKNRADARMMFTKIAGMDPREFDRRYPIGTYPTSINIRGGGQMKGVSIGARLRGALGMREAGDDHHYGAWHGGSKASGGGPGPAPGGKAARVADLASKIGAKNVGRPGEKPGEKQTPVKAGESKALTTSQHMAAADSARERRGAGIQHNNFKPDDKWHSDARSKAWGEASKMTPDQARAASVKVSDEIRSFERRVPAGDRTQNATYLYMRHQSDALNDRSLGNSRGPTGATTFPGERSGMSGTTLGSRSSTGSSARPAGPTSTERPPLPDTGPRGPRAPAREGRYATLQMMTPAQRAAQWASGAPVTGASGGQTAAQRATRGAAAQAGASRVRANQAVRAGEPIATRKAEPSGAAGTGATRTGERASAGRSGAPVWQARSPESQRMVARAETAAAGRTKAASTRSLANQDRSFSRSTAEKMSTAELRRIAGTSSPGRSIAQSELIRRQAQGGSSVAKSRQAAGLPTIGRRTRGGGHSGWTFGEAGDDHPYGNWQGGSKASGGHPVGGGAGTAKGHVPTREEREAASLTHQARVPVRQPNAVRVDRASGTAADPGAKVQGPMPTTQPAKKDAGNSQQEWGNVITAHGGRARQGDPEREYQVANHLVNRDLNRYRAAQAEASRAPSDKKADIHSLTFSDVASDIRGAKARGVPLQSWEKEILATQAGTHARVSASIEARQEQAARQAAKGPGRLSRIRGALGRAERAIMGEADDHFYGAWHGGSRASGGGPGAAPTKAGRVADLASKIGAKNVGQPGEKPGEKQTPLSAGEKGRERWNQSVARQEKAAKGREMWGSAQRAETERLQAAGYTKSGNTDAHGGERWTKGEHTVTYTRSTSEPMKYARTEKGAKPEMTSAQRAKAAGGGDVTKANLRGGTPMTASEHQTLDSRLTSAGYGSTTWQPASGGRGVQTYRKWDDQGNVVHTVKVYRSADAKGTSYHAVGMGSMSGAVGTPAQERAAARARTTGIQRSRTTARQNVARSERQVSAAAERKNIADYKAAVAAKADKWVVGGGGREVPVTRGGKQYMYVFNPATGKHGYRPMDGGSVIPDSEFA